MWDLVGNPEDRFSHNEAHLITYISYIVTEISEALTRASRCCFKDSAVNMLFPDFGVCITI